MVFIRVLLFDHSGGRIAFGIAELLAADGRPGLSLVYTAFIASLMLHISIQKRTFAFNSLASEITGLLSSQKNSASTVRYAGSLLMLHFHTGYHVECVPRPAAWGSCGVRGNVHYIASDTVCRSETAPTIECRIFQLLQIYVLEQSSLSMSHVSARDQTQGFRFFFGWYHQPEKFVALAAIRETPLTLIASNSFSFSFSEAAKSIMTLLLHSSQNRWGFRFCPKKYFFNLDSESPRNLTSLCLG